MLISKNILPSLVISDVGYRDSVHREVFGYSIAGVPNRQSSDNLSSHVFCELSCPVWPLRIALSWNVLPDFVTAYVGDRGNADGEGSSYLSVHMPKGEPPKNFQDFLIGKLRCWAQFSRSAGYNSCGNSIVRVILRGACVKMFGVVTQLVVAFVKHPKTFRNRSVNSNKCQPVGFDRSSAPPDMPVAVSEHSPRPQPATFFGRRWVRHFAEHVAVLRTVFLRSMFYDQPFSAMVTI